MTDLKTINRIVSQPVKEHSIKEGTVLKREVIRVIGINITVKSQNIPGEPINRYTAFMGMPNLAKGVQKLIDNNVGVTAHIKLIKNRWELLRFDIEEMNEPEELSHDDGMDPGNDY